MKKRLLSLALMLSLLVALIPTPVLAIPDDVINFPDPNFEAGVRWGIDKPTGPITKADVADVTYLYIWGRDISSLSGIENFTALTRLEVHKNKLKELDISKNTALKELRIMENQLTKLDVSKNTALESLECGYNQLTKLDVSNNTALKLLGCNDNQLTELDVNNNTALTHLFCSSNQLTIINVSNNAALEYLDCYNNDLPEKSAIIGLDEGKVDVIFFPQRAFTPNMGTAAEWAKTEIISALKKGFIQQEIQEDFARVITRQEFCLMAVLFVEYALDKDIDYVLTEKGLALDYYAFSDTSDSYILAAFALGITNGTRAPTETMPGLFTPGGQFSRQEAATMLMRVCKVIGMDTVNPPVSDFMDLNTAAVWARDGINFVRANGIMGGVSSTTPTFNPKGTYTRQESIVTFDRIQ
jgi:hypothetical protein